MSKDKVVYRRMPSQIMDDFWAGTKGTADIDMEAVLWEILDDVLHSMELTLTSTTDLDDYTIRNQIETVRDYMVNHYGE